MEDTVTSNTKSIEANPEDPCEKAKLYKGGTDLTFNREIVWKNAIGFLFLHLAAVYGLYLCFFAHWLTILWMLLVAVSSGEGITIGAHRLYSHKSFKASFGLKLVLVTLQTMAGQNCTYIWVRDHRQHHKYSDTDADPHNATRGFFFSHVGWLMSRKHPEVIAKGKGIDMSDLEADPIVMFQKKYYKTLYTILAILIPVAVPVYFWNESITISFFTVYMFRYILVLHVTWSVNSVAHLYGTKPFDKYILPVDSRFVSFIGFGEGWHNYHHTFPWDYRAAELNSKYNYTARFIEILRRFNLAYDLKTAPFEIIRSRSLRTGDGTYSVLNAEKVYFNSFSGDDSTLSRTKETFNVKQRKAEFRG